MLATIASAVFFGACSGERAPHTDGGLEDGGADGSSADRFVEVDGGAQVDAYHPTSCDFGYDDEFVYHSSMARSTRRRLRPASSSPGPGEQLLPDRIAHIEPLPEATFRLPPAGRRTKDTGDIVMPDYQDDMELFARGGPWTDATRCYETPAGTMVLTEPEAYELYRDIAELTTGVAMDTAPGVRTVVGVRGAYPGRLFFNSNLPDRFNDTLVLMWVDEDGESHVREFPANTDTGAYDFGWHSSSSLRPNRRYRYINGWHRSYNALRIDEYDYLVWDDANKNGHWDSDRNGWLEPPTPEDHERIGGAHNIHMGSVDGPLGAAVVGVWSAGCQVIPGMANWTELITNAWTREGDPVSYFLVDVRDIDHRVWGSCTPDGTHACPYKIGGFPFIHSADTAASTERELNVYSCSTLDESGPEVVYFFTVDRSGTLTVSVDDVEGDDIDVDIHLLDADDPDACLERAHISFSKQIGPGRYFIVADTYVDGGQELCGPYTLEVDFQ